MIAALALTSCSAANDGQRSSSVSGSASSRPISPTAGERSAPDRENARATAESIVTAWTSGDARTVEGTIGEGCIREIRAARHEPNEWVDVMRPLLSRYGQPTLVVEPLDAGRYSVTVRSERKDAVPQAATTNTGSFSTTFVLGPEAGSLKIVQCEQ